MITLTGEKMASRVAASLLRAAGMEELVCSSHSGEWGLFAMLLLWLLLVQ